uniref:Uncharacterized protein n=1 Tax=Podoviridae sp. ctIyI17 TaxID=2825241 RepID=A0A8S5U4H9_9CAUD|nr:MAG TPA: hypothetical protein [Podoviridae sp. ctIyI17]
MSKLGELRGSATSGYTSNKRACAAQVARLKIRRCASYGCKPLHAFRVI